MGLNLKYIEYINSCVLEALGGLKGKSMLELGDQDIISEEIPESTGKEYYMNRGVFHTSFDLNGESGAVKVNLSRPIRDKQWLGAFDIVTTSGTIEHVEPFEKQNTCFMNVHNCLKPGGIAIHLSPDIDEMEQYGHWKGHCNYYYSHAFFVTLAELNGYSLLSSKVIRGNRCVCLQKNGDVPFTANKKRVLEKIAVRFEEGSIVYFGINDHPLIRPITWYVLKPIFDITRPARIRLGLTRGLTRRIFKKK